MSILTKYQSLSPEAQKQMEDFLDFLLSKQQQQESERISIEQYNKELDQANARIDSGEYTSHEDVKKESEKWLK